MKINWALFYSHLQRPSESKRKAKNEGSEEREHNSEEEKDYEEEPQEEEPEEEEEEKENNNSGLKESEKSIKWRKKRKSRLYNDSLTSLCIISHHPFFSTFRDCLFLIKNQ